MSLPKIADVVRLTTPLSLKFLPSGKPVAEGRAVMDKRKKDDVTGEWSTDKEIWFDIKIWGPAGENLVQAGGAQDPCKGWDIFVIGDLSQRTFERKDGSKGTALELHAYKAGPDMSRIEGNLTKVGYQGGTSGGQFGGSGFGGGFGGSASPAGVPDPWGAPVSDSAQLVDDEPPF